jgi:Endonuclease/Exonuclease/phosphatase family.
MDFFKYRQKLINISKVIVACGDGDIPSIVGLCEIENDSVIIDLMRLTHLHLLNYKYVVTNSPDARGINIALLYKRNVFKLFDTTEYPIILGNKYKPTRNILHVSGILPTNDTLDVFVCHFPSRSGGEIETRNARKFAHMKLIDVINNVNNLRRKPLVIVMGDFNDYPTSSNLSYLKRVPERVNNITNTVKSKKSTIIKSVDNFNNTVDNYNAIVNMEFSGLSKTVQITLFTTLCFQSTNVTEELINITVNGDFLTSFSQTPSLWTLKYILLSRTPKRQDLISCSLKTLNLWGKGR